MRPLQIHQVKMRVKCGSHAVINERNVREELEEEMRHGMMVWCTALMNEAGLSLVSHQLCIVSPAAQRASLLRRARKTAHCHVQMFLIYSI